MCTFPEQQVFFDASFPQVISSPEFHGFTLDDIPHIESFPPPACVDIGRRQVIEWLVVAVIVVVIDKVSDLLFQFTRHVIILQVYNIFQGTVIALYLALCLRIISSVSRQNCIPSKQSGHFPLFVLLPFFVTPSELAFRPFTNITSGSTFCKQVISCFLWFDL